ncbi:pre-peptidase C-terminal domain-containing protein [Microlunatus spumicola]|uniref:Pre-peptidase C-terminal domain-containing protein n=1 Tax=Microlunatus spumicola TaxID=81499 RepID=A0ABP6XUK5_9ACTN
MPAARAWAAVLAGVVVGVTVVTVPTATEAAPSTPAAYRKVDRTLGNGLGRLLAPMNKPGTPTASPNARSGRQRPSGLRVDQESLAVRDAEGRVLVDLTPQAGVDRAGFRRAAEAAGLVVQAVDPGRGTLEGFVGPADVPALAGLAGRGSLAQAVRPRASVGDVTSQGVALQRVDRVQRSGVDGAGVTIGALSDSYDTATRTVTGQPLTVHAADDVASGDLPGPGNAAHPDPVVVLDDRGLGGLDEGRAMLQIAHDVAPAARLCFASAQVGEVQFAENIRRLADPQGPCGADVVVDDIAYFDEPMFSDGILSDAVDDVAGQGVHYVTSAGNQGSNQAWDAPLRLVDVDDAVKGSNLDLRAVDPALYDGGFVDLKQGSGVDVAQNLALGPDGGLIDLQWDDPVDLDGPTLGRPWFSGSGTITSAERTATFAFTPTDEQEGKTVQFRADGIPSGTTDLVMTVTAPDGTVLATSDTGSSETFAAELDQAGAYRVDVSGYEGETGDFTVDVSPVEEPSGVTTDLNVLLFGPDGTFLGDAADVNAATGRPLELLPISGLPEVQMVVSRSGTGAVGAHRLRTVLFGDAELAEHVDPGDAGVFGHATARGATAVAAYDPFGPFLPEPYTAVGGTLTVTYDSAGRRLPARDRPRKVPQVAGADGTDTTFFGADSPADADDAPNFFGTSAAAPHVAGIAALVVQQAARKGATLTPVELRERLQDAAYAHDRDPFAAEGKAAGVTLGAEGAQSPETGRVPGSMTDTHFFTLRNRTGKTMRSVTLDGSTASPSALGLQGTSPSAGVVFDPRPYDATGPRGDVGFPFTIGSTAGGLKASTVSAAYEGPTGDGRYRRLVLTFAKGLERGDRLEFGVDRDLARSGDGTADEGNGADELGGATLLPSGKKVKDGLTFTVRRTSGGRTAGELRNDLGHGFERVDGYGLVDAEEAVLGR